MKNALFTILFLVATSGFSQNPSGTAEKANPPPIQRATRTDVEHRFGAPTFTDKEFNGICQELYGADIWTLLDLMDKEKPQVREDSKAKLTSLLTLCGSKSNDLEAQVPVDRKEVFCYIHCSWEPC